MTEHLWRNPFRDNVVQDAWQTPPDVPEIHDDVFRACLSGIDSAAHAAPDSLLIYGPAGAGKTHLLTRVQRHLADTAAVAPDRVLHCVFVFVRLQTSPSLLWQHVRKRLTTDLMRRDEGVTQLQRLVAHQLQLGAAASPRARVMGLRVLGGADQETLLAHLATVADSLGLSRDLHIVLEHLVCGRFVRDAAAWLAGESLPDAVLAQLGIGPDTVDDREAAAREVVTALCRLAGETLPIVFCFDQVEALQRGLDDRDAFYKFGRMAADLCDADPNVFLITCLQSSYLDLFKSCIRGADRDRMARREAVLQSLTRSQIEKLLSFRLEQARAQFAAQDATRSATRARSEPPSSGGASEAPLRDFALSPELLNELAQDQPCVARRVLANAARWFEAAQARPPEPRLDTASLLLAEFNTRRETSLRESTPADMERLVLQGLQAIATLREIDATVPEPKTADFVLGTQPPVMVEICNEADGRSLGPRLKRILGRMPRPEGARTVILRDPRLPIPKTATKTREHLEKLRDRGAAVVEPTVEALAALAALGELLADAKSGDLNNDGAPVSERSVVEWLRSLASDLLVEPVTELVDAMIEPTGPSDSIADDLADLLARKRILEVEMAAALLDVTASRLTAAARAAGNRFLVLDGPPEVLVDISGIPAASEES